MAVKSLPNYRIWLRYSDGAEGEVDFSHLAGKGVFKLWDNYQNFERVYLSDVGAIAWSDAVEICPDATYMRLTGKSVDELFPEPGAEAAWEAEIARRIARFDAGESKPIAASEVFARLRDIAPGQ